MEAKPKTAAQRQAAYRERKRLIVEQIFCLKGLPALPAIATIPGWPRWKEAMPRIVAQMQAIETEMDDYYHQRSDRWHESEQAQTFYNNIELLRVIIESAQDWPE